MYMYMDLWKMVTLMGDAYHRLAARLRLVSSDVPGFLFRCGSLHTRRICVAYTHPQGKVAQQAPRCYDLEERTPIRHPAIWSGHGMGGKVVTPLALRVPEVEEGHD